MFDSLGAGRENMGNWGNPKAFDRGANKQVFIIFRDEGDILNQRIKIHQKNHSGYLNERKRSEKRSP